MVYTHIFPFLCKINLFFPFTVFLPRWFFKLNFKMCQYSIINSLWRKLTKANILLRFPVKCWALLSILIPVIYLSKPFRGCAPTRASWSLNNVLPNPWCKRPYWIQISLVQKSFHSPIILLFLSSPKSLICPGLLYLLQVQWSVTMPLLLHMYLLE